MFNGANSFLYGSLWYDEAEVINEGAETSAIAIKRDPASSSKFELDARCLIIESWEFEGRGGL